VGALRRTLRRCEASRLPTDRESVAVEERAVAQPNPGGRSPSGFNLDWLLAPVPTATFFGRHWETERLFIARDAPDYYASLPGLDAVDELLTATTPRAVRSNDDGRLVKTAPGGALLQRSIGMGRDGIPDVQAVYGAYHDGFTIVLNEVHRRSSPVAHLCRALESDLHHRVGANLYLTPRDGQGFLPHVDTHDVFILQLHGVKEWRVSGAPNDLPLTSSRAGRVELRDVREYSLRPGDLLYLPRGAAHEAVTSGASSLHLTVGIHVYRRVDLLAEALAVLADEQVDLRVALPPQFLDHSADAAGLPEIAQRVAIALGDDSVLERAKSRLGARLLRGGRAASGGHFRSLDAIHDLDADSIVARAAGVLCTVRSSGDEASIEFESNYVAGPVFLEPALRFVAERDRFTVLELPGHLSLEDKIDLVSRLVSEGLLTIESSNGGET
jgi:lysine-specific demethylase/histidyl-hydroxylase NO66